MESKRPKQVWHRPWPRTKQANDTLHRLEPLLPKGFATAEQVDQATTASRTAAQGLAAAEQKLNQAKTALSTLQTLLAQRPGAVAAVKLAELELSYCKVIAPFTGRVINLNISAGAYASVGIPVFSLLDTRKWYVVAKFSGSRNSTYRSGQRSDCLPLVRA